jgi:predicted ArsR family transcriptional regulator
MLNAVLREVRSTGGDAAVQAIFASMSRRQSKRLKARIGDRPVADRVAALTDSLRESDVEVEFEATSFGFRVREHHCPYSTTVTEHPEICSVIRSVMQEAVAPQVQQTDSLATGGTECRFEITTGSEASSESPVGRRAGRSRRFRKISMCPKFSSNPSIGRRRCFTPR